MAQYGSGLSSVKIGEIEADGGMGLTLLAVGNTVQGSMQLTSAEGTSTPFNIEESDKPVKLIITPGETTLNWECYDISGENMVKLFGGTYDAGTKTYSAPDKTVALEYSVELTSAEGHKFQVTKMSIFPSFNWAFTKDDMAKVALTGTILAPDKVGEPPFRIVYAA